MVIDDDTDWAEVADLITESYRVVCSTKAGETVGRPREPGPASSRGYPHSAMVGLPPTPRFLTGS